METAWDDAAAEELRRDDGDAVSGRTALLTGADDFSDLAALVAELTGFKSEIAWEESMPNGQPRRKLDTTRVEDRFGVRAVTPLREGPERTIAGYRD
jgi:nucleoside-diphosphate-sugar epimerase